MWLLRWDLSPLGYLKTAAHGHLDALHLSVWFKGVAMVIDPGTGAYYADENLRAWLASREAHNGPSPMVWSSPVRLGPFLWSAHHDSPRWEAEEDGGIVSEWHLANGLMRRRVTPAEGRQGWQVEDSHESRAATPDFAVRWQFAPGCFVKLLDERRFSLNRNGASVIVGVGAEWAEVELVEEKSQRSPGNLSSPGPGATVSASDGGRNAAKGAETDSRSRCPTESDGILRASASASELEARYAGTVSQAFRKVEWAPYLKLVARPQSGKPCVFRTTFLASAAP